MLGGARPLSRDAWSRRTREAPGRLREEASEGSVERTCGALRAKGLAVLEAHLGPVHTLRFLALLSRESFDYQGWRQQHFGAMGLEEILVQAQSASSNQAGQG